jgi:hypothetical protein
MGKVKEEEGVPRRFENPVEVPTAVFDGLETVQESRETSTEPASRTHPAVYRPSPYRLFANYQKEPEAYTEGSGGRYCRR